MKRLFSWILYKWAGWKTDVTVPERPKCIMCVAPHTSNWDFIYAFMYDRSYGGTASFLMKRQWFFWPLGILLRHCGGVAVNRSKNEHLTDALARKFNESEEFHLAITPEGTRSLNNEWKKGFYFVAQKANIPIRLYVLDYGSKLIRCNEELMPSGDVEADMQYIRNYYSQFKSAAKYPEKFGV